MSISLHSVIFVDRIYLSPNCEEILNDTLRSQLCKMTGHQCVYIKFFTISPEYNEDIEMCIKAYHFITINSSKESRFQINDIKPKKQGYYNSQWTFSTNSFIPFFCSFLLFLLFSSFFIFFSFSLFSSYFPFIFSSPLAFSLPFGLSLTELVKRRKFPPHFLIPHVWFMSFLLIPLFIYFSFMTSPFMWLIVSHTFKCITWLCQVSLSWGAIWHPLIAPCVIRHPTPHKT